MNINNRASLAAMLRCAPAYLVAKIKLFLKSFFNRAYVCLALVAYKLRIKKSDVRVVMFPSGEKGDPASHFRVYQLAKALNKLDVCAFVVPYCMSLTERKLIIKFFNPDYIYFQQCRHPFNDSAYYSNRKIVLDSDDADILDDRIKDKILRTAADSSCVVTGSHYLEEIFSKHSANTKVIWTGVSIPDTPPPKKTANSIVWAQSSPASYKHEFRFICNTLKKTALNFKEAGDDRVLTFIIFNISNEIEKEYLSSLREQGIKCQIHNYLPISKFNEVLSSAEIGLHYLDEERNEYAKGKGFGKILSYMINRVCIVSNKTNENKYFITDAVNGCFAKGEDEWAEKITRLICDSDERRRLADQAFDDCKEKLDINQVAKQYRDVFHEISSKT